MMLFSAAQRITVQVVGSAAAGAGRAGSNKALLTSDAAGSTQSVYSHSLLLPKCSNTRAVNAQPGTSVLIRKVLSNRAL